MSSDCVDGDGGNFERKVGVRKSLRFLRKSRVSSGNNSRPQVIEAASVNIKSEEEEAEEEVTLRSNSEHKEDTRVSSGNKSRPQVIEAASVNINSEEEEEEVTLRSNSEYKDDTRVSSGNKSRPQVIEAASVNINSEEEEEEVTLRSNSEYKDDTRGSSGKSRAQVFEAAVNIKSEEEEEEVNLRSDSEHKEDTRGSSVKSRAQVFEAAVNIKNEEEEETLRSNSEYKDDTRVSSGKSRAQVFEAAVNIKSEEEEEEVNLRSNSEHKEETRGSSIKSRAQVFEAAVNIVNEEVEVVTLKRNIISAPKEDMSRIKSAFIGNDMQFSARTSAERKSSRLRKFVSSKSEHVVSSVTSNFKDKMSKLKSGHTFVTLHHSGVLLEPGPSERTEWRVALDTEVLRWISDRGKKMLPVNKISSITAVNSGDEEYKFGFEICTTAEDAEIEVFAAKTEAERSLWMQRILEVTISDAYPESLTNHNTRAGLVNIKEGVGGLWIKTWLILQERDIFFCSQKGNFFAANLRKVRSVVHQEVDGNLAVLLDLQERVLYLQDEGRNESETRRWSHCLRDAALYNGDVLSELQLTKEDVPVVLDMCLKFVSAHGVMTDGIYRRVENTASVSTLLSQFRLKDAWKLQLDHEYPLEVAKALLTFLAELKEPLLPVSCIQHLVIIPTSRMHEGAKVYSYRQLMLDLPRLHYITVRRVFGHLYFLHSTGNTCARNLADCWITAFSSDMQFLLNDNCANAIETLIEKYPAIFEASAEEIARDEKVLHAIQRLSDPARVEKTRHSELRVWINVGQYQSARQVQVLLDLSTKARDVLTQVGGGNAATVLEEVVLGGALSRPLHPEENVMSVVMRWSTWQDIDRKDNQLVVMDSSFYTQLKAQGKPRSVTLDELKFADASTRHFSVCDVELTQTSLVCYKDKRNNIKHGEWNVKDIVWYVGFEPKREPLSKWTITIISKDEGPSRSREKPYFGFALGGSSKKGLLYWSAGFMLAQFPGNL